MNTITIELCAEDRARLDRILAALENGAPDCKACARSVTEIVAPAIAPEKPQDNATAPAEELPWPEASPHAEPAAEAAPARVVTPAEIQQKVVELSAAGKKAEVREIITAYAVKVSAIPEDKRAEVLDKLTALEG